MSIPEDPGKFSLYPLAERRLNDSGYILSDKLEKKPVQWRVLVYAKGLKMHKSMIPMKET